MEDARRQGLAVQYCFATSCRSAVSFLRGALADSVADGELSLDAIESNGLEVFRPFAVAILARPLIERASWHARGSRSLP